MFAVRAWPFLLALVMSGCTSLSASGKMGCQPLTGDIPWGALSGLAASPTDSGRLYAVHDHNLSPPQILVLETSATEARITQAIPVKRHGKSPQYDLEGIAHRPAGGFWLASEGKKRRPNLLVRTDEQGRVLDEIPLPAFLSVYRVKAGLEGIAAMGSGADERVAVVFQRRWKDDPKGQVKIGLYWPARQQWQFWRYPLDRKKGTGLSAATFLTDGRLAVLERDNRPFHKARIKKVYVVELKNGGQSMPLLDKRLLSDILARHQMLCGSNGKLEGMTVAGDRLNLVADDDGEGSALLLHVPVQDHFEKHW